MRIEKYSISEIGKVPTQNYINIPLENPNKTNIDFKVGLNSNFKDIFLLTNAYSQF